MFSPHGRANQGFVIETTLTVGYFRGLSIPQALLIRVLRHVLRASENERTFRKVRITVEPIED